MGHWETGKNVPSVFVVMRLAQLYKTSTDSLLWDEAPSTEAMQFAAQYDNLTEDKRSALKVLWMALIQDGNAARSLPAAPKAKEPTK